MNELKQRLKQLKVRLTVLFKDRKPALLLAAGVLGIMLILISEVFSDNPKSDKTTTDTAEALCMSEYEDRLEIKLCDTVSAIDGAGRVKVMLTIDCGEETVFAANKSEQSDMQTDEEKNTFDNDTKFEYEYIIIKSSGSAESGLPLRIIQPKVRGVAVVCDGGDNPKVRLGIIQAVSAALGLSSAKISVTAMSVK